MTVVIEPHDDFRASSTVDVLRQADRELVGLLCDTHDTFASSGKDPPETLSMSALHLESSIEIQTSGVPDISITAPGVTLVPSNVHSLLEHLDPKAVCITGRNQEAVTK